MQTKRLRIFTLSKYNSKTWQKIINLKRLTRTSRFCINSWQLPSKTMMNCKAKFLNFLKKLTMPNLTKKLWRTWSFISTKYFKSKNLRSWYALRLSYRKAMWQEITQVMSVLTSWTAFKTMKPSNNRFRVDRTRFHSCNI